MKKPKTSVEHHIIYGLPGQKKRQGDLTMFITEGEHTVITDVMYSVPLNSRMMGWALIFEGMKRLMRSDIEQFNKERGHVCQTQTPEKTGKDTPKP
jgi:hypothetical protein